MATNTNPVDTSSFTPPQLAAYNYAASLAPITPSNLQPQAPVNIPPVPTTNYVPVIAGGNATIAANTPSITPPDTSSGLQDIFKQYLGAQTAPPSAADQYNTDYANSGIGTAQTDLNAKTAALKAAQSQLAATNAQIAGLTAQGQAMNLQQEGRQAPMFQITGQQAQNNRQIAIAAIPLQVQALAQQAQVAAAQGDAQLSQSILQQAQQHLDTVYQLHQQDAQAQYKYKTDLINSVYDFASKQEQAKLDALKTQQAQAFTTQQNQLNNAQALANTAISNGNPGIASKILALDPSSPTYAKNVAAYAGQIQPKVTTGLLSVSEAQALGVPYGTTQAQAIGMGKTPQKQATAAQETTALYANRIEQSNAILSQLDNTVAQMNPVSFQAQQKLPQVLNVLKSANFQSVDQAQRNFVNAVLRRESGAVISPQEFDNARQQYFALPGDTPATIAQKKANRDLVQQGFVSGAGQAYTPLSTSNTVKSNGVDYVVGQVYQDASGAKWTVDASGKWTKQ